MLRLVFCDIDGTLLPAGQTALSVACKDTLRRLTDRGITVVLASGRPYGDVRALCGELAHRLRFICLDGALTRDAHCVLHKRPLPRAAATALLHDYPNAVVHGRETVYVLGDAPADGRRVSSPLAIGEPFLKLGIYAPYAPPASTNYRTAYAERGLTELVAPCAHKGNAALTLMQKLGISPDEAVAFGDGDNDRSLLSAVGHPYRMRGTLTDLPYPETDSVPDTLRTLFHL